MSRSPLADRMRPKSLDQVVGQEHLLGPGRPLSELIGKDRLPSLIFWGPPGCGKTTLARLIAVTSKANFHGFSAVQAGLAQLKEITDRLRHGGDLFDRRTILFIDEIHRWNKAQQDALLPFVEDGRLTLMGATTENPSFEVIGPLLSRCQVFWLAPLSVDQIGEIIKRALGDPTQGLGNLKLEISREATELMAVQAGGDARRALNTLEVAADLAGPRGKVTPTIIEAALQKKVLLYDKGGEEHYNVISAFIKSMRASDPDAAVYYLARLYEAGENPRFIARRMVIFAAEDVGNADPQALPLAVAAAEAFDRVGEAEGWIPLAQTATYLATAPKSKASYQAYLAAKADLEQFGYQPVPMALRNPVTPLMAEVGYGKGTLERGCLPEKLKGRNYYSSKKEKR